MIASVNFPTVENTPAGLLYENSQDDNGIIFITCLLLLDHILNMNGNLTSIFTQNSDLPQPETEKSKDSATNHITEFFRDLVTSLRLQTKEFSIRVISAFVQEPELCYCFYSSEYCFSLLLD
ncbi:hypothetical protein MXB_3964 [Myxobolus squamalis]|nr:hypothetical protein MXB_3964 [Myxobolus squamalis]